MGKKKEKKKLEREDRKRGRAFIKALKKSRKAEKKQSRCPSSPGTPGTPTLNLIDIQKMWQQIAPQKVQPLGHGVYQYTWEFVPGQECRDLFYWRDHKQELERQEGLHE